MKDHSFQNWLDEINKERDEEIKIPNGEYKVRVMACILEPEKRTIQWQMEIVDDPKYTGKEIYKTDEINFKKYLIAFFEELQKINPELNNIRNLSELKSESFIDKLSKDTHWVRIYEQNLLKKIDFIHNK